MTKDKTADPAKAAAYPPNNSEEYDSVITFAYLLDKTYVKPSPSLLDKIPNTDGDIEIVNLDQTPIGKCDIQIKTLPDKHLESPKYQCTKSFLAYCAESTRPVLLVVANADHQTAYWLHVSKKLAEDSIRTMRGESIVLEIPKNQVISRSQKDYIQDWISIIESYKQRFVEYDSVKAECDRLRESISHMKLSSMPLHSIAAEDLAKIEVFIDTLNNALDNDFSIVKDVFYHGIWKLGIAYAGFKEKELIYKLYPISYGQNDLLVREISRDDDSLKGNAIFDWSCYTTSNPIKESPIEYAYGYIKTRVIDIVRKGYAKLVTTELASEYIIEFADYVRKTLGGKTGDTYNLSDLIQQIKESNPLRKQFPELEGPECAEFDRCLAFGSDSVSIQTVLNASENITNYGAREFINKEKSESKVIVRTKEFDSRYLGYCINYLRRNGIMSVSRLYPGRRAVGGSGYVWRWYSPQSAFEKIGYVYKKLPDLFDAFIALYFPRFQSQIRFFNSFDRLIINVEYKADFKDYSDQPEVQEHFFKCISGEVPKRVDLYLNGTGCPIDLSKRYEYFKEGATIDGVNYRLLSWRCRDVHYIFERNALQKYLHKLLEERLDQYFKLLTSEDY